MSNAKQIKSLHDQRMAVYNIRTVLHGHNGKIPDQAITKAILAVDEQLATYDQILTNVQKLAMLDANDPTVQALLAKGDKILKGCTKSYLEVRSNLPEPAALDKSLVTLHTAHKDELGYVPQSKVAPTQKPSAHKPEAGKKYRSVEEREFGYHIEHDANGRPIIMLEDSTLDMDDGIDIEHTVAPSVSPAEQNMPESR